MKTHTVEKIGGTSIAATDVVVENVLVGDREGDALYGRVFVVSAYAGITNLLLEHKKTGTPGVYRLFAGSDSEWAWSDAITRVGQEMRRINAEVLPDRSDRRLADNFVSERIEGVRSVLIDLYRLCSFGHFSLEEHLVTVREMLSALGEAHSAFNTSLILRQRGLNATFVDLTGWRDERQLTLDERIHDGFTSRDLSSELPIVTGYAQCREGMVETFGRGYTELTFSRIAVLTGAREAIIHKEFHLSSADPKIVPEERTRKIGRTNYDVADQLANMGMEAIHPRAARGLRQADIPLRVKNTFDAGDEGTVIQSDYVSSSPRAEIVTGLTGVFALELFDQDMVGFKGYDAAILESLTRNDLRVVTKCANANTITHYVAASLRRLQKVQKELLERFPSSTIRLRKVALVSVIGSDLDLPRVLATVTTAMEEAGVPVLGLQQLLRRVDLQVVLEEEHVPTAIRALHAALIEHDHEAPTRLAAPRGTASLGATTGS